ncbi:MAG: redoxin domain-containing protein [Dehalococcoidia bacterium]
MTLEIGQPAPDFTLRDENNQEVKLSELRGSPVVLMFYPLDFSPLCTKELCSLRDNFYKDYQAKGAKVFGISRDSTWTHKAFKEQEKLDYSLLADMKGDVARQHGAWNEQFGVAERLTVIVDADGNVQFSDRSENMGKERDQSKAVAALQG